MSTDSGPLHPDPDKDFTTHKSEAAWDFNLVGAQTDLGYPLIAPAPGKVAYARNTGGGFGNVVIIDYGNGTYDRIAHLDRIFVAEEEQIKQGQVFGTCGKTGGDYSPHIHINGWNSSNTIGKSLELHFHYKYAGTTVENGRPLGCTCISGYGDKHYVSMNENIIKLRESTPLTDANPFSGHTPEHQPLIAFGPRNPFPNEWGIGWYHAYKANDLYFDDGTPKNCYVRGYVGRAGGAASDGAVVYDALGGARSAYVVGWLQWAGWHERRVDCTNDWKYGEGGPNSCLGMPVTNSYLVGSEWRQDFQKRYMLGDQWYAYSGGTFAPGWAELSWSPTCWNPTYSYIMAEAYEKYGAWLQLGSAISAVKKVGNTYVQRFEGKKWGQHPGPCSILYLPPPDNRTMLLYEQMLITGYSPVVLTVVSPDGDSINPYVNSIGIGASYEDTIDYNGDGDSDDRASIGFPVPGEYKILVYAKPGADSTATYSIGVQRAGTWESFLVHDQPVPSQGEADSISYQYSSSACLCGPWGDVSGDGQTNPIDVVKMVNFVYKSDDTRVQPPDCPKQAGDANCDEVVNPVDVVLYVNYVYKSNSANWCANPCGP